MIRLFVLREAAHFDSMVAALRDNWTDFANAGKPLGVHVAPYKKKRTDEQNALMWVWLEQIAREAWTGGRQYSAETWHEHCKREFLPDLTAKGKEKWNVLPTGERVLAMSTTDLNVAEMSIYMEKLSAFASTELGITLLVLAGKGYTQ